MLISALTIVKDCKLLAEKQLTGSLGIVPVDYIAEYNNFCVLLTEAKKGFVEQGSIQNIAQIARSLEPQYPIIGFETWKATTL